MITYRRLILLASIASIFFHHHILHAAAPLTDAQRLSAVYEMYEGYKQDFPEVIDINPDDLKSQASQGQVLLVDVRRPEEIRVSTLPGAIDKKTFLQGIERYKGKKVVVFCTISYRSGIFAQEMAQQGVNLQNLKGGILAWTLEGGEVVDDSGSSKRLHVYGPKWDLAPIDFETIKFGILNRLTQ